MKHRVLLGIICIILALVTVFLVAPLVTNLMNGRTTIIRAVGTIQKGQMLTAADFETATVGAYNLPANVVKDVTKVIGLYAAVDIVPGSYILPSMVTKESIKAADVITRMEDGEYAITIGFPSFAAGFAGQLTNGDIVRLCAYDTKTQKTVILPGFEHTQIITTVIGSGLNKDEIEPNEDGTYTYPSALMLKVNDLQSKLIVEYMHKYGSLHIIFLCHRDDEKAEEYMNRQKTILAEMEAAYNGQGEETTPQVIDQGDE